MRGKGVAVAPLFAASRITPAYAGKSDSAALSPASLRDHPRVCGEKGGTQNQRLYDMGSPPRMRGKVLSWITATWTHRITPAYAGKSQEAWADYRYKPDHPRVCGEKHGWFFRVHLENRITPAYAGKRLKRSRSTVPPVAIVPLFPSVCNKPVVSDGSPAGRDAPLFLPAENAVPASPAYNLRSL